MTDATKKTSAIAGQAQTTPTPDRTAVQNGTPQSGAPRTSANPVSTPRQSARQRESSTPPMTSDTELKKRRAPMSRHRRKCVVCHHPSCKEIEQEFLRWLSPSEIARIYGLADYRPIYRHMHATGIFAHRQEKLRLALDPLIEKVMDVKVSAHAILRAIATSDNLKDARKWIGRPGVRNIRGVNRFARAEINAAVADEAERICNRETAELEPGATR